MNKQTLRDLKWFRSLSKRDFDNGATLEEIEKVFKEVDALQDRLCMINGYLAELADFINFYAREEDVEQIKDINGDFIGILGALFYRLRERIKSAQQACQDR